jgi:DNA-binding CsgD family transcriptional regulator
LSAATHVDRRPARAYRCLVELLERDGALAALAEAHAAAAGGQGSAVLVSGEPGIGKTALVSRFTRDLDGTRVLWGACDDLSVPRPLGPFHDMASPALEHALAAGAPPHEIQALLIAELSAPTVVVLEDVHWADDATLDVITVLGRRLERLPALLVLTFRSGEIPPGHPLHAALAAAAAPVFIELAPLSPDAVAELAGDDAAEIYALTRGNPFYVTELLAADTGLPPSVAAAVLARAARLDEPARRLLELACVVPNRIGAGVLDSVMPDWAAAAEQPERQQLLEVAPAHVRFRHELARHAIRSSLPVARRRLLHAEILAPLLATNADPSDIVHHAEAAGDQDVVADYAPVAARRAAALDSNREAYLHYARAAEFAGRLPLSEQALLAEELAQTAYAVNRLEDAFPAMQRSIALYREVGDKAAVGRCTRVLSRFHWYAGDGEAARMAALAAVSILEPEGDSVELARAYSGYAQLAHLAEHGDEAIAWGERALALATRLGDEHTRVHALINIATARFRNAPEDTAALLEAHDFADAAGDRHEATRALLNLGYNQLCWADPEPALRHTRMGLAYGREHEVHTLASLAATGVAWLQLRAGAWEDAERGARAELGRGMTVPRLVAETVVCELAVRRGDPDAPKRLADLIEQTDRAGEPQRIAPALQLETEWALTHDIQPPVTRFRRALQEIELARDSMPGGHAQLVAAWASVAGLRVQWERAVAAPHAAMLRHDWAAAADAFGAVGWHYERALMLSLCDDEAALRDALEIARELGAGPLAERVTRRMRRLGLPVPRGPRAATRGNPVGLTARQLEVLQLVIDGLTNADIADRLVISTKTAEHHVSAVLGKLGINRRHDAGRRALELGLVDAGELLGARPRAPRAPVPAAPAPAAGTAAAPRSAREP